MRLWFNLSSKAVFLFLALGSCAQAQVSLRAEPQAALVDMPVEVTVTSLQPNETVALVATLKTPYSSEWRSQMTFRADSEGRVTLAEDAPVLGSYEGVAPMGFVYSMTKVSPDAEVADGPLPRPSQITLSVQRQGKEVAQTRLLRRWRAPGVTRREVKQNGIEGVLYRPSGKGPFPGIVLLGGSEGGLSEFRAALLASHGYATLALAYFDYGDLPDELLNIPLEYFSRALDLFAAGNGVDPERIAVWGGSRGGELALLLGATYPEKIAALVALVPSGVVVGSPTAYGEPAWTFRGEPLPSLTASLASTYIAQFNYWMRRGSFDREDYEDLLLDRPFARAIVPIEQFTGPILMVSGTADEVWPSSSLSKVAQMRLEGYPFPFEHLIYKGAGHALAATPYIPMTETTSGGGDVQTNAEASENMWQRGLAFLSEALAP